VHITSSKHETIRDRQLLFSYTFMIRYLKFYINKIQKVGLTPGDEALQSHVTALFVRTGDLRDGFPVFVDNVRLVRRHCNSTRK